MCFSLTAGDGVVGKTTMENKHIIQSCNLLKEMIHHMGDKQKQKSTKLISTEIQIREHEKETIKYVLLKWLKVTEKNKIKLKNKKLKKYE